MYTPCTSLFHINSRSEAGRLHARYPENYPYCFVKYLFFLLLLGFSSSSDIRVVTRVVDGDTIAVTGKNGIEEKIRLIGMDAHEVRNTPKKKAGFYGKEATAYLRQRISGKKVRLEYDIQRYDRYRRTLAYVYLEDGTFINAELVRKGYAVVLTVAPNVKYAEQFILYQQEARKNHRGLWGVKMQ